MNNALQIARNNLLSSAGMDEQQLSRVLDRILSYKVDAADLYFQSTKHESWSLEDGIVKEGSYNIEQGVGVRAISGEKTGFAYSDEIVLPQLLEASRAARAMSAARVSAGNTISSEYAKPVFSPEMARTPTPCSML